MYAHAQTHTALRLLLLLRDHAAAAGATYVVCCAPILLLPFLCSFAYKFSLFFDWLVNHLCKLLECCSKCRGVSANLRVIF